MKTSFSEPFDMSKKCWGRHITFTNDDDWPAGSVYGHMTPLPKDGFLVSQPMVSGRTIEGRLRNIEPCGDPPDMFFATIEWDLPERKLPKAPWWAFWRWLRR